MAALLAVTLAAFLALSQARPEQASTPDFEALFKEFQTSVGKSFAEVKKSLNIPDKIDGNTVVSAMREQAAKSEKAIDDIKKKLEEAVKKNPELSQAVNSAKSKLDEAKENLKKTNPEVAANAEKFVDTLKSNYDSVSKEMEKIHAEVTKKGGIQSDFENLFKNILDRGIASAKEMQVKFDQAVKKSK